MLAFGFYERIPFLFDQMQCDVICRRQAGLVDEYRLDGPLYPAGW